jgi:hypothetical protein
LRALRAKKNKLSKQFWTFLAAINLMALIYPFSLLRRAESSDETLIAAVALMVVPFLLMVADAITVVIAEVIVCSES